MGRNSQVNNERGLTLVEILASLVILGIVFVAFMTIFPQMSLFNNRTETKLETMNVARIILEEYKNIALQKSSLDTSSCPNENWTQLNYKGDHEFKKQQTVMIKVKNCPAIKPMDSDSLLDGVTQLNRVYIEIKENGRHVSESFGYVKVE